MKINPNTRQLEAEAGEAWQVRFEKSPNSRLDLQPNELILHATGRASVGNAVQHYLKAGGESVHLLLGRDGQELVQLVALNRQAQKIFKYNRTAVSVALDYYPGSQNDPQADPRSYLVAIAGNNKPYRVALYPRQQLDALLELAVFLQDSLELKSFLSNDEINVASPYPGLGFPLTSFREKLFERTEGKMGAKVVLEEISQATLLRNAPSPDGVPLSAQPLPVGTPVSMVNETNGWVRVEIMDDSVAGPWQIGWVEEDRLQAGEFKPMVRDGLLYTTDNRQYKFIPAYERNFESTRTREREDVNFVVMHITTGTRIQSSINYFQSPNAGVSAHLVIGRDGRVVQMVPFNQAAFHAGGGSWEERGGINQRSIGIEVDNAGQVTHKLDDTYVQRTTIIPESQIKWVQHWKSRSERPWHKFTPIQLRVTEAVVLALKDYLKENLQELLEHERISLRNRSDPGPLFPMEDLRMKTLEREQPRFQQFRTIREGTELYENNDYTSPELNVPTLPSPLPECEQVEVLRGEGFYWTKIKVRKCSKKPNMEGKTGWVRKDDVKYFRDKLYKMTKKQDFYKDRGVKDKSPSRLLKTLPAGIPVRVQKTDGDWKLIAPAEHKVGALFLEGWVRSQDLEKVPG